MAAKTLISSDLEAAKDFEEGLLREVARHGYSDTVAFAIKLALQEGLNNAIRHGNRCDPRKTVEIDFQVDKEQTSITITDQGRGFDPRKVPDPTTDENLQKPCGRGIMLMRAYMDEVRYNRRGNQIHMVKRNTKGP